MEFIRFIFSSIWGAIWLTISTTVLGVVFIAVVSVAFTALAVASVVCYIGIIGYGMYHILSSQIKSLAKKLTF